MSKIIEIPFGAKDSELKGWECTIPEGMEAVIENGKVIVKQKESEDERIRKSLLAYIKGESKYLDTKKWIAYLEKQKEQKPAEWSEEDKRILKGIIGLIDHDQHYGVGNKEMLEWFKSLRPVKQEWSEDETIRKKMIEHFKSKTKDTWCNMPVKSILAWLEKQKEQKSSTPKYRVGDVMRTKQEAAEGITDGLPVILSVDEDYYYCTNEKIPISEQEEYEFPPMNMKQKQPEVDLEKEIDSFLNEAGSPVFWCNDDDQRDWCSVIALHFYELGRNARKEE